jgi:protein-disulfide isomerase
MNNAVKKNKFWDNSPMIFLVLLTCGIFASVFILLRRQNNTQLPPPPAPILIAITSDKLTQGRFFGALNTPYALVEFGDYQCPPCKGQSEKVFKYVKNNSLKLRYFFHNFPLPFHTEAMPAAIGAESIIDNQQFWIAHKKLMASHDLKKEARNLKLSTSSDGKKQVDDDMKLAKSISINSTPSFFLCCPDGRVYKLGQLDQVEELMNQISK